MASDGEFTEVYAVLRGLAARQLRRGGGHTLDTTALVHEAWLKLHAAAPFDNRGHFLAVAATAMRHILVDHARKRLSHKRGGDLVRVASAISQVAATDDVELVVEVDVALTKLATFDARLARVVEWRFFAGLEEAEIASALGVDVRTVRRDFRKARAFILEQLTP
ncbi:MAG: ECF-type sigma factor [Kofleriaceae bacterium]